MPTSSPGLPAIPTEGVDFLKLPDSHSLWWDTGPWKWVAIAWLFWLAARRVWSWFRGSPASRRQPSWPVMVMVWTLAVCFDLSWYAFEVMAHGVYDWAMVAWFQLIGTAWQLLLLLVVLGVAAVIEPRAVSWHAAGRSGLPGALAGLLSMAFCWLGVAAVTTGPIVVAAYKASASGP